MFLNERMCVRYGVQIVCVCMVYGQTTKNVCLVGVVCGYVCYPCGCDMSEFLRERVCLCCDVRA